MAVPSYTTDLITLALGILSTESWDESSDATWDDAGSMVDDGNLYYNGSSCVSAQFTKDGIGTIIFSYGSGITVPTNGAILIHHLWAAPPALATLALGGIRILYGDSYGDFYAHKASGSDAPPAPRGGWANYAIDPAIGSPDYTVGTPSGVWSFFGVAVSATAQARGNPNAINAIRYGRCTSIFEHGETSNYATFLGFSAIDSSINNKWNLIDPVSDTNFDFQGLMSLGTATNAVDFRDANKSINIIDTINVTSAFNRIEVNNASSNIEWNNINITALGTTSRGSFEVIDNATIAKNTCVFTDMDTFIYQSNSDIISSTYRRCNLITQGSSTITGTKFDSSNNTVALLVNVLGSITGCTFESDGTGHGVDLGTISSTQSLNWNNYDTGYTASSSGNETILVSVDNGITLTINVGSGYSTPSVYNTGTGTVNVVSGQVTLTIEVVDINTGLAIANLARVYVYASAGGSMTEGDIIIDKVLTNASGEVSDTRSYSTSQPITGRVRKASEATFYKTAPITGTIDNASGLSLTIQMIPDE